MGHPYAISSAAMESGPTGGHRQRLIRGELGQFHVIGITYLFREMGQLEAIGSTAS
jgi:hypothetical protein